MIALATYLNALHAIMLYRRAAHWATAPLFPDMALLLIGLCAAIVLVGGALYAMCTSTGTLKFLVFCTQHVVLQLVKALNSVAVLL
jgi:hypothetical protein